MRIAIIVFIAVCLLLGGLGYMYVKSTPATSKQTPTANTTPEYVWGTVPESPKWTAFWSNDPAKNNVDLGESASNALFAKTGIVKRVCNNCTSTHAEIYYKRVTPIPTNWSMYKTMINTWSDTNNTSADFKLYSSLADLKADKNAWTKFSFNDPGIGFPRDSGPMALVGSQWTGIGKSNSRIATYYVLEKP